MSDESIIHEYRHLSPETGPRELEAKRAALEEGLQLAAAMAAVAGRRWPPDGYAIRDGYLFPDFSRKGS